MNLTNMTGDPNQETRPSVFKFETYPMRNAMPIEWNRIPMASPDTYVPLGQFHPGFNQQHEAMANFSFCTTEAPHPAQFPFPTSSTSFSGNNVPFRCKRKTDSPPLQPCKQHITEEKMAEHMARLHISSETAVSKETDTTRTQRLYMCEEMRKLQNDPILPHSLLSKIQRPCTALVLWTPPQRIIELEGNNNGNNNEESVPDNNRMENDFGSANIKNNVMDFDNI